MRPSLRFYLVGAVGVAVAWSVYHSGFDPDKPTFLYCLLMVIVLASLVSIIRSGLDRTVPMSKTNRMIRVVGGSIWALAILAGMAIQVWMAIR